MIEATDEFRVPPTGALGRHFPFTPSQATIPEPKPLDSDPRPTGSDEYEVRLVHEGDNFVFTFNIANYNGDGVACGRDIAIPTLVIGNLADNACTPSHTRRLFEAIGHTDKEMHEVPGATHYYAGPDQRDKLRNAVAIITDWLVRHDFASAG